MGDETEIEGSFHPPVVKKLHYQFDDWLGDAIAESFPCFLVTAEAGHAMEQSDLTGASLDRAKITASELFNDLNPEVKLPEFLWLKVSGVAGDDDMGTMADGVLVLSERAKQFSETYGIQNAVIRPFAPQT